MIKKKNRLSTSAKALVALDAAEQAQVNGGQVFGIAPIGHHPVFGVIFNPHKHHHKPPFFGVPVKP